MSYTKHKDPAVNAFVKTNLSFASNPLIAFQDPTYLGFKLLFFFDQPNSSLLSTVPHVNTAIAYLNALGEVDRAHYLTRFVDLLRGLNSQTPWFFQSIEGLEDAWKRGYSDEEDFKPLLPDQATLRWVQSRMIAYAKRRERQSA